MHGNHLCGQCGYGGWRIKRHDDIARVLLRFLRAAGFCATDKCFDVYPACPAGEGSTKYTKRIPDIVATDQYGTTTAHGVMVTHPVGSTAAAHRPLYAAAKGEKGKQTGYDEFKDKCRAMGSTDPRLSVPLIPLLFETYGGAGRNMQEFVRGVVRSFSTQILNLEDKSAESYFRSHWTYQISVALMRGTAAIIHHVPRGESVPAHSRRPTKQDQFAMSLRHERPFRGRPRGHHNLPDDPSSPSPSPNPPLHDPTNSDDALVIDPSARCV